MDRVSGRYKRRVQWMLVVLGLLASASLNIDTINLARVFWNNETLRSTVATAAENYLKTGPAPTPASVAIVQENQVAVTAAAKPALDSSQTPKTETTAGQQPAGARSLLSKLSEIRGEIDRLGLPIGWVTRPEINDKRYVGLKEAELAERYKQDIEAYNVDPLRLPHNFNDWFLKVLGICLTALAVSQGAPFWFDLLNRIVTLRSVVKPREKKSEEQSS
jgi:hypothetical protein